MPHQNTEKHFLLEFGSLSAVLCFVWYYTQNLAIALVVMLFVALHGAWAFQNGYAAACKKYKPQ